MNIDQIVKEALVGKTIFVQCVLGTNNQKNYFFGAKKHNSIEEDAEVIIEKHTILSVYKDTYDQESTSYWLQTDKYNIYWDGYDLAVE